LPADARSILIVRLDHIGDLILTTPFLREVRRNWPAARITLLVTPASRPVVEYCPYVDRVEAYQGFRESRWGSIRRLLQEIAFCREHLWSRRFDLALVPRWDTQLFREGVLAYLSGARMRVGFAEQSNTIPRNDHSYECLYTHLAPGGSHRHEVEKCLSLLTWLGVAIQETRTEVWIDQADRQFAAERLPDLPANVRVAMVPGSSSTGRRWPAERFGEVAAWIVEELGGEIVLLGAPGEAPLGVAIEQACPRGVLNLMGQTSVRQAIAVLERCGLYVGNDTGPMHMAAATGTGVVSINPHPADGSPHHERFPLRFCAWDVQPFIAQPAHGLDDCVEFCEPGERGQPHCILAVTTDQVKALIREALGKSLPS
jgi:heptosyltransferase-2